MKHCKQCGAALHGADAVCPQCGASKTAARKPGAGRHRKPGRDEIIRVSAADVVVQGYPALLTEEKSPEQLLEEERAYLEDRDPVLVEPQVQPPQPITLTELLALDGPCITKKEGAPRIRRLAAALAALLFLGGAFFAARGTHHPTYLLRYAQGAVAAHNYEGAIITLERLALLDAENPEVYLQLVNAHQALGQDAKAFAAAQAGYEITQDDRLRAIVTQYTFGAYTRQTGESPVSQPQDTADDVLPSGLVEDTITVLPAVYEDARAFCNGLALVRQNGLWGGIDHTGAWVIQPIYDELTGFSDSSSLSYANSLALCPAKRGGVWGYVDIHGDERIAPQYEAATPFVDGRAAVKKDGEWVVITSGGAILSEGADAILSFSSSLAAARKGSQWGYLDRTGEWAIAPVYDDALPFAQGLAAVRTSSGWGYIDTAGRTVITPQYTEAYAFADGIARVKTDGGYQFINPMGWQIGDGVWQDARDFQNGLAVVSADGLYGVINRAGDTVVPCIYSQLGEYAQGLCPFYQNGLWGYLDRAGSVRIPPQFLMADGFCEGVARVAHPSGVIGYIITAGQYISDARFEDGGHCAQNRIAVKEAGTWGYLAVIAQLP